KFFCRNYSMNIQTISQKINAYERLMRLDKPIGILLLLWPTLWALLIAGNGKPDWIIVLIFVTAATYPFTKRFLALPQAYLGIAFGMGIPMAFAAITDNIPIIAWVLFVANIFWAIAYDTEYAMVDREDDLKIDIKSSAITFGKFDVVAVM
ncbi:unnamed protein product, partial [Darwinula stevensoni]